MIAVHRSGPPDPLAERVREALQEAARALEDNERVLFETNLYKRYRDYLKEIFANKCAYCEITLSSQQSPVIEHYRPKGRITDENDETLSTVGYWWLAYEWGNLLPSCWVCNSTHKKNRFPVRGLHALDARTLRDLEDADEGPLIFNPLNPTSLPEQHIEISLRTGMLRGKDAIGRMTIKVLGLNRVDLVDHRRRAILDTENLYEVYVPAVVAARRSDRKRHERTLASIADGSIPFAFARRAACAEATKRLRTVVDFEK